MTMRRTDQASSAGRRGEPNRDVVSRRPLRAVDAQRRLNDDGADLARTKADPHGPVDPRHAYLMRSHD
jgi:hypothetical protein